MKLIFLLLAFSFPLFSSYDWLHFGRMWDKIRKLDQDLLFEMIFERRKEIAEIKEHWRPKIEAFKTGKDADFYQKIEITLNDGNLVVAADGYGAAYFLMDKDGKPCFVVKPIDEDILCLNNRKQFASPYNDGKFRVRTHIPLYRSPQAEAVSYATAQELGLAHMTPKTVLSIISSENFYDISDTLKEGEKAAFLKNAGEPDKEKLCSIQEYIPHMQPLFVLYQQWSEQDLPEEAIVASINQDDIEDAMILVWTLYDTDAHGGNILANLDSNSIYRLKKFDNGLTFPEKNSHLFNTLSKFLNSKKLFTERAHQIIKDISIQKILEILNAYEMQGAIDAFLERMVVLQELNEKGTVPICEIDLRLKALELSSGREIALSSLSQSELERQIFQSTPEH